MLRTIIFAYSKTMVVLLVNHISTEIKYVYSIYMIPLDMSHTCLFLSDTFREKSLIRSHLMDLFLFSDKTCLIPITDALPALSTDSVNTTPLFVDGSRQPTHLFHQCDIFSPVDVSCRICI